jgi:hypothetical protein
LQLGDFLVHEVSRRQRYDYEAHKGDNDQHDDGVEDTPYDERTHDSSSSLRWPQRKINRSSLCKLERKTYLIERAASLSYLGRKMAGAFECTCHLKLAGY